MDFGIKGKRAIVCAASKGLGKGCAMALAESGVDLVINARTAETLEATAQEIRDTTGVKVETVACDITSEEGRNQVLAACPDPDILVNNAGGPPPGNFRDWREADWLAAVNANMITPIELIRLTVDKMGEKGWGRIVNITSTSVKAPIDVLGLSNGARAGLTGFVAGTARQVAATGVTINSILPGRFDTDRLKGGLAYNAQKSGKSVEEVRQATLATLPTKRFGEPHEFGAVCAFLCSVQAGYITAQNIVIDGGAYPGTL